MAEFLNWFQANPHAIPIGIGLIAMAESIVGIGIAIPGIGFLIALSAFAGASQISVYPLLIAGFIGAVIGDNISFWIGRYFKDRIHGYWPFRTHPQWIDSGVSFFMKYGPASIFLGRFIGPIRHVVPVAAGLFSMSNRRFLIWNVISASLWAPVFILPGYLLGESFDWKDLESWLLSPLGIAGLFALTLIAGFFTYKIQSKRPG